MQKYEKYIKNQWLKNISNICKYFRNRYLNFYQILNQGWLESNGLAQNILCTRGISSYARMFLPHAQIVYVCFRWTPCLPTVLTFPRKFYSLQSCLQCSNNIECRTQLCGLRQKLNLRLPFKSRANNLIQYNTIS